jgi:hypothetical protein
MATIANQNGRHMEQHVLLPVNIHFHWNILIFEFLTIYFDFLNFYIGSHSALLIPIFFGLFRFTGCGCDRKHYCKNLWSKFGVNLTFFPPWLPWQWPPFWICSIPQTLPHTTVDIPTKFHEVWWKESNFFF